MPSNERRYRSLLGINGKAAIDSGGLDRQDLFKSRQNYFARVIVFTSLYRLHDWSAK
jgi:hypothetical protein